MIRMNPGGCEHGWILLSIVYLVLNKENEHSRPVHWELLTQLVSWNGDCPRCGILCIDWHIQTDALRGTAADGIRV